MKSLYYFFVIVSPKLIMQDLWLKVCYLACLFQFAILTENVA